MPPLETFTAGGTAGLIAALIVAVVAFATGKVVPGKRLDEALDLAKSNADRGAEATAAVVRLAAAVERLTKKVRAQGK